MVFCFGGEWDSNWDRSLPRPASAINKAAAPKPIFRAAVLIISAYSFQSLSGQYINSVSISKVRF